MSDQTRVLIVGGGTAGHVLPGVAIGRELVDRGLTHDQVHFVGSERGVESKLVPAAGFEVTLLPGRGIARRMTKDNIGAVIGLMGAFARARSILRTRRPDVVVALGGYASVPAGLWAAALRVPIIVAEQNAVPGLANRILSRFARSCAVSYDGTDLPRAVWTGNPVRPEILDVAANYVSRRAEARARFGLGEGQSLVAVFGGSLGARTINDATISALDQLGDRGDIMIRHIIGRRDHADISERTTGKAQTLRYEPIEYEDDMASVFAAADLVICRAGATSCAELAVTNTPAVLVPLPGAPGDHQTANARALEAVGGAEIIADDRFDGAAMAEAITRLLASAPDLETMRTGAAKAARPDAAAAVVDVVAAHTELPSALTVQESGADRA